MHAHRRPERHQPHERILRQQAHQLHHAVLRVLQLLRAPARAIHAQHEARRRRRLIRHRVLHARVRRKQLRRQVIFADLFVIPRQFIQPIAQRASPRLAVVIHRAVRIQRRLAPLAHHRFVRQRRRGVPEIASRRHERADRQHHARGFDPRARPRVPRQPHALASFQFVEIHLARVFVASSSRAPSRAPSREPRVARASRGRGVALDAARDERRASVVECGSIGSARRDATSRDATSRDAPVRWRSSPTRARCARGRARGERAASASPSSRRWARCTKDTSRSSTSRARGARATRSCCRCTSTRPSSRPGRTSTRIRGSGTRTSARRGRGAWIASSRRSACTRTKAKAKARRTRRTSRSPS